MTDDDRTALRHAFTVALVTAVATQTITFAYEEVRGLLARRREARAKPATCEKCATKPEENRS